MQANRSKDLEAAKKNNSSVTASNQSSKRHFDVKKKDNRFVIRRIKRQHRVVENSWEIKEEIPLCALERTAFRKTLKPFHKGWNKIFIIDSKEFRE